tara:strand:- start:636 stop:1448 length:813 start_codon:yes stop_codon:yes gene_type:complete
MGIMKSDKNEIKPFKFGQLIPSQSERAPDEIVDFEMKPLAEAAQLKNNLTDEIIRAERAHEAASSFNIDPRIKEHRGLVNQEKQDYENAVAAEVARRLEDLSKEAYNKGISDGRAEGMKQAYDEALLKHEENVVKLADMIENLGSTRVEILESSKEEGYKLIKNLTKWIVLKEVEDKEYIQRLLEKLILEMNTKSNLLIKVDNNTFGFMPEIIKFIEDKLGALTNVRVEVQEDMSGKGIVLESENGIIDGTLEAQFISIDKLFESVGVND